MTDEQRDEALFFLECNTEELAGLPNGSRIQAIVNFLYFLDCIPIIEPNRGGNPVRAAQKFVDGIASNLLLKFEFFGKSKIWLQFYRGLKK